MNLIEAIMTQNPCYTAGRKITVKGLMLHSVGCPQPSAQVFIRNWNDPGYKIACVHGFIDANTGDIYQTLPWDHRGWHCASGRHGSGNNTHIGVEMCEPSCIKYTGGATFTCSNIVKAREAARKTYAAAVELFAMLCEKFNLDPLADGVILSHAEGYQRGIASNHGDPEHLWKQLGMPYTMDSFRAAVKEAMKGSEEQEMQRFNKISEMPDYAQPTITKLVDRGFLTGCGTAQDENGKPADLDLSVDMIRLLVILDRACAFDDSCPIDP